jgi:maleate cis-trans isomerase
VADKVTPEENYENLLASGYGWRARIGFLSPGIVDETLSRQFYRMAPDGVTLVRTSLGLVEITVDAQHSALARVDAAARELAKEKPACIILGGSPTVVVDGFGTDEVWTKRIFEVTGIPASAAQTAAIEAMRRLGMHRIAVATPFPDPINGMLKEFLEKSGFEVAALNNLGIDYRSLTHQPLRAGYELAKRTFEEAGAPDGIYFPGAPFPVVDLIQPLENELATTVVSSGQATLWKGLQMAGAAELTVEGYGRLLRHEYER